MKSILQFLSGGTRLFLQGSHCNRLVVCCRLFVVHSWLFAHAGVPLLLLVGSLGYLRHAVLALLVALRNADGVVVDGVRMRTDVLAAIGQLVLHGLRGLQLILLRGHLLLPPEVLRLLSHVFVLLLLERWRQSLLQLSLQHHIGVVLAIQLSILCEFRWQFLAIERLSERMVEGVALGGMQIVHGSNY
jgi:hypothetical protein